MFCFKGQNEAKYKVLPLSPAAQHQHMVPWDIVQSAPDTRLCRYIDIDISRYLESAKCIRHQAPAAKQLHCSFHAIAATLSGDSGECSMYCRYCSRAAQMISTAGLDI